MKKLFVLTFLCACVSANAWNTIYSSWNAYNSTGGTNINSGDTTNSTPDYSTVSGNWNGVDTYTPTDGSNPVSHGVAAGRIVHVYTDGSTTNQYLALVMSAANSANGAIVVSTQSTNGFIPASASGTVSLRCGGALAGPYNSAIDQFPFGPTVQGSINSINKFTNSSGDVPLLAFNGTWINTNSIQVNNAGATIIGYTNAIFDGGYAHFFGTLTLTGPVFNVNLGKLLKWHRLDIATNAHVGTITNSGINVTGSAGTQLFSENKCHELWWSGIYITGARAVAWKNELWHCNLANNSGTGAFFSSVAGNQMWYNFIHDNTGSNNAGAETDGAQMAFGNIVVNNNDGFRGTGDVVLTLINNEISFNARHGINFSGAVGVIGDPMGLRVVGNNIFANGGVGITNTVANGGYFYGTIDHNFFGAGSMANVGGDLDSRFPGKGLIITNNVSLPSGAMPWAATNNYALTNTTCKNGAPLVYLNESGMNYVTTTSFVDSGAVEHLDTATTGGGGDYPFAQ